MNDTELQIVENMERFGGSFVQALAVCFRRADPFNFRRLRAAFPEYWEQYKNFNQ